MNERRFGDRVGGCALFLFNPVYWLLDAILQRFWPMEDPEPPQGIGITQKVLWEVRYFTVTAAILIAGVAAFLVLLAVIVTLADP